MLSVEYALLSPIKSVLYVMSTVSSVRRVNLFVHSRAGESDIWLIAGLELRI